MKIRAALLVATLLSVAGTATAQTSTSAPQGQKTYQQMWDVVIDKVVALRKPSNLNLAEDIRGEVTILKNVEPYLLFAYAQSQTPANLRALEGARTDKQLGAPAASGGSTSLVSKGSVPRILAFAVEHGAATQTSDATSATVRGNAVGWLDLLRGQGIPISSDGSALERSLRKISYSFTFNVAQAEEAPTEERPTPAEIEADMDKRKRQLTAYSVRFSIVDQRDPRRADNRASGQALLGTTVATETLTAAVTTLQPVLNSPAYKTWLDQTAVALSAPGNMSRDDVSRVVYKRLEDLRQVMLTEMPDFDTRLTHFVKALRSFEAAQTQWFEQLQRRFVLAAEMVRNRPPSDAGTSTYRLVGEGRVGKTSLDLTLNVALTHQDSGSAMVPEPKETGGWRDMQFAVQAELPLGKPPSCLDEAAGVGRPALAFEYLSRKLFDKAVVTFAGHDFSVEPGWIHVAQAKVTIPMKGSGVKIPISISVANRTELLKEKNVRGHIGLTFDLDVLASAVRR